MSATPTPRWPPTCWRAGAGWKGREVFFLTGTDEHGQKVEKAAQDAGMDPQAFTDGVSRHFRDLRHQHGLLAGRLHPHHGATPQARLRRAVGELAANGEIYLGHYEGWYAVRDEAFYGPTS
jgi:methionyl-tRNA synthetase